MGGFFSNNDQLVKDLQIKVDQYKSQLANNELTKPEYDALISQTLDIQTVVSNAKTIEEKEQLQEAIEALIKIAQSVPIP